MECSVCYEKTNAPARLRCQHVFCKPCLKSWYLKGENGNTCPMCRADMVCRKNYKLFRTWDDERIDAEKDEVFEEAIDFYADEFENDPEYLMYMCKKLQYIYSVAANAGEMEEMIGIWDLSDDEDEDEDEDSETETEPSEYEYDPSFFDTLDYDAMANDKSRTKRVYHNEPRTWEISLWYTRYPKLISCNQINA